MRKKKIEKPMKPEKMVNQNYWAFHICDGNNTNKPTIEETEGQCSNVTS